MGLPFEVSRGDFMVSTSEDGQTCWIALGDSDRTKQLVSFVKESPDWKYSRVGSVRTTARSLFGLAPRAAKYNRNGSVERRGDLAVVRRSDRQELR
jgi:hypothetical protein